MVTARKHLGIRRSNGLSSGGANNAPLAGAGQGLMALHPFKFYPASG